MLFLECILFIFFIEQYQSNTFKDFIIQYYKKKQNDEIVKIKQLEEENKKLRDKLNDMIQLNDKMKAELEKYKNENKKCNEELIKANKIITNLSNKNVDNKELQQLKEENIKLKNQINIKDNEIKELKNTNKNTEDKNVNYNDIMVVNFISQDSTVHCGIKCLQNDIFAEIEEKLYQKFDNLRETNNMFTANAKPILRFKKLYENNIHDGDVIQLIKIE